MRAPTRSGGESPVRFWVGGYGVDGGGTADGIGVVRAGASDDPLAGGDLAYGGTAVRAASPSWIALHPALDVIYAAQEHAGTVAAFVRTGAESFAPLGGAMDAGAQVCHVAVAPDGAALVASCWGDGRVVRYPLRADGRLGTARIAAAAADPYDDPEGGADEAVAAELLGLGDLAGMGGFAAIGDLPLLGGAAASVLGALTPEGAATGADTAETARTSRAHQARFLPDGVIATTDVGYDLVRFWAVSGGELHETQRVVLPRGAGPRHTVWHPSGHLYVVTESSLEVFVLAPDRAAPLDRRWRIVSSAPLGAGILVGTDAAAEIALTRDAGAVLVGVRGSDTIAALRVAGGGERVATAALVESGVHWPRHHTVERDTVLVAGQHSDEIVSLSLDERTGVPGRVRRRVAVPTPTHVRSER